MSKTVIISKYTEKINNINIQHEYYPCKKKDTKISRNVKYIVIHYTGNTKDTAMNNAKYYMSNDCRNASAHFFVDDISIYQSVPLKDSAWHCGTTGTYRHAYCRNNNSIGIEMCTSGNYIVSNKTIENAAYLCASLCKYLNITDIDTYVLRHYDVTGKKCPAQFVSESIQWDNFKKKVKKIMNGQDKQDYTISPLVNKQGRIYVNGNLNVRAFPNADSTIIAKLQNNDLVDVIGKVSNGWYQIKMWETIGYINGNYVKIEDKPHWAAGTLNELVWAGFIQNPEIWSKYEEKVTKAQVVALLCKINKIEVCTEKLGHWSYNYIYALADKGYIKDYKYWINNPDASINRMAILGLICNFSGGISYKYQNDNSIDIGTKYLNTLYDKGIITDKVLWSKFYEDVTRGLFMQLCYNTFLK